MFELGGNDVVGMAGDIGEEAGVGLVSEGITAGPDGCAGIEVAVADVAADVVVVCEDEAHGFDGAVEASDVELLGTVVGAFDGEHPEGAEFGQDVDEAGVEMAGKAGALAIGLPIVVDGCLVEVVDEKGEVGRWGVRGKVFLVEDGFGAGDVGEEAADGELVDVERGIFLADEFGKIEAVGFEEGAAEKRVGDFEPDVFEIGRGSEATFAELIDVEGELGPDVGVWIFGVVDDAAVFLFELWKLDGNGAVGGDAVAEVVSDVMGERADGEGELVGSFGVGEEGEDKVSGAYVVGEIGEVGVTEGVVAEVLNGAATVGVGVRLFKLGGSEIGEAEQEKRTDGLLPGEVDEFFVRLDGVGESGERGEDEAKGNDGLEERFAVCGEDVGSPVSPGTSGRGLRCFFALAVACHCTS